MIDRIIEAFTKPKIQVTAVDELIQSITVIVIFLLISVAYIIVSDCLKNRKK